MREQKIQLFMIVTDDFRGDHYLREFIPKEYTSFKDAGLLSVKKLKGTDQWAFSITMNYRATYVRSEMGIIITAIGTHKEVLGD